MTKASILLQEVMVETLLVARTTNPTYWVYYALAKLGRWHDSKATGIVGWEALWDGRFILIQLLEGAILMQQQIKEM